MSLLDLLNQAQGGKGLAGLGEALGLDARTTEALAGQFAPAIAGGMKRRASAEGGLGAVLGALRGEDKAEFFDDPRAAAAPQARAAGHDFLGQILGADAAPRLSAAAAERTGVPEDKISAFLPALAAMMQGGLQRQAPDAEIDAAMGGPVRAMGDAPGSGLGDLLSALGGAQGSAGGASRDGLGGLLGSAMNAFGGGQAQAPQAASQPGSQAGLGQILRMLDADGDGSPFDDVLGAIMR